MPPQRILLFHIDGVPWHGPADPAKRARLIQLIITPGPQALEAFLSAPTAQSLPKTAAQEAAPTSGEPIGASRQ